MRFSSSHSSSKGRKTLSVPCPPLLYTPACTVKFLHYLLLPLLMQKYRYFQVHTVFSRFCPTGRHLTEDFFFPSIPLNVPDREYYF